MLKFGVNKKYEAYMKLRYDRCVLMAKYLQTKDMNLLQRILILDVKKLDIEKSFEGGMGFDDLYGWLIKEINTYLPLNKTSVEEYYTILNYNLKLAKSGKAS